ncbi:MAG TPA: hypothetical protein H9664_05475 [Firmicutes bacterium]|nr:hypothetical protein [Bacillota bacterium]
MNKRILAAVFAVVCLLSLASCVGQGNLDTAPTAVAVTPPAESEIISYFDHFNIDILSAEQTALENKLTVTLESKDASSEMSASIKLRSRSQNGTLTAICETTGEAFDTNSSSLSYYDGTAAYYESDKSKIEMTPEEFKRSAYILPFIQDNITEDNLENLEGLELEGIITYYFTLKPEAVDFSALLGDAQFNITENASVSIEMSQGNPKTLTVSASGTYINAEGAEYSAVIAVSVQPLEFEDFSLPDNLNEYQTKNA